MGQGSSDRQVGRKEEQITEENEDMERWEFKRPRCQREEERNRHPEMQRDTQREKKEPQKRQLKPVAELRTGKGGNLQLSVSFVSGSHVGALLYLSTISPSRHHCWQERRKPRL